MAVRRVYWLLVAAAFAAAGCRRGPAVSAAELDAFADAADGLVSALRGDAPEDFSLLAALERRTLLPGEPTPVEVTAKRVAAVEVLQREVDALWPRWSDEHRLIPDLSGLGRWIHDPGGLARRDLVAMVNQLDRIGDELGAARRRAGLPPRPLALDGRGPAALAAATELPGLPAGIGAGGVRLWPLADAVVVLQFGSDPAACPTRHVACLHRQLSWVDRDGAVLDWRSLTLAPGASDAWHAVAAGTDALFALAIPREGPARLEIHRPGQEPRSLSLELDYGADVTGTDRGLVVGALLVTGSGDRRPSATTLAPPAATRAQFLERGRGSRDWFDIGGGAVARVEQRGRVIAFVRREGDRRDAVRLLDLPAPSPAARESRSGPVGTALQLAVGSDSLAVAIALPPNRLVVLVSADGGRTWSGGGASSPRRGAR